MKNYHLRIVTFIGLILLSIAGMWYYLFLTFHNELFIHLTAVFIEVGLSIAVVDFYLEKIKKESTLRLYFNARREFFFSRVLWPFNRAFTQFLPNTDFLNVLGKYPSHDPKNIKLGKFNQLSNEIVQNIDDGALEDILKIIDENYEMMERQPIFGLFQLNEELYEAMSTFHTNCYKLMQYHHDSKKDNFARSYKVHNLLIKAVESWLYIINNFIYYWNESGRSLRQELKQEMAEFQQEYKQKTKFSSIHNISQLIQASSG